MDVVADLPADAQAAEPVQKGDGLLDDPASGAESGAVADAASGDDRGDPPGSQVLAVAVVVVAPVGVEPLWSLPWSASGALDPGDLVDQGYELGDVMAVAAGQTRGEGGAARVGDDVVFRAWLAAVDRARAGFGPPLSARMWEPSITARDMSSWSAARSLPRSTSCSRCQTPASFQSRNLRQQVMPDPKPSSWGRYSHGIAV